MPKYHIADASLENSAASLFLVGLDDKYKEVSRKRVGCAVWKNGYWIVETYDGSGKAIKKYFSNPIACSYTNIHKRQPDLRLGRPY